MSEFAFAFSDFCLCVCAYSREGTSLLEIITIERLYVYGSTCAPHEQTTVHPALCTGHGPVLIFCAKNPLGTKNDGCGQKSEGDDGFVGTIKVLQVTQSCWHLGYWATPKAMPDSHHPQDAKQGGKSERTGKNQCTTSLQGTWGSGDPGKRHGNCGRSGLWEGETGCRI